MYGLGALGKEGVTKALEIIKNEADMTMALCGRRDVHDLNSDNIYSKS
jgi:L-lactate dehydrogenase (cytochrome)